MPHTTGSIEIPSLKLSANFCVYYWSFSGTQWVGTSVSTTVAYSDFTSRSPDYVLSKAGLFSTKLLLPELCYFTSTLHKVAIF